MGREIKRVPLDFDWPLKKVWAGFLMPDTFDEDPCPTCRQPISYVGERPHSDGYTPEARAIAETFYPHMIGGPRADELAWCDKLGQAEVDMLVEEGRVGRHRLFDRVELAPPYEVSEFGYEIRHDWVRNATPGPSAEQVNAENRRGAARARTDWSGLGGHDGINRMLLIRFRCKALGISMSCPTCSGHGSLEAYKGQRAEAEAWESEEPPTGDGWQLWETTSEGSPISRVFKSSEALAVWLTTTEGGNAVGFGGHGAPMTLEAARGFVGEGWAPSMIGDADGIHDGAAFVGARAAQDGGGES